MPYALLLAPGAGADSNAPGLLVVEEAVTPYVKLTRRMDFPYRKAGRKAPDRAPVLLDAVRVEAQLLIEEAGIRPKQLLLGGRSMGGRMCSMAVADGLPARGLILLSYPLHPPGKSERLRTEHFPGINVPCLFVSGTRDAFASPEELRAHTQTIPGDVTLKFIEGGDHGMAKFTNEVAS